MLKKSIKFVGYAALFFTPLVSFAQSDTMSTSHATIKAELPIAPVGSYAAIENDINKLNALVLQTAPQKLEMLYASIGGSEKMQDKVSYQRNMPLILVGLAPGVSNKIIENNALNTSLHSMIKNANSKGIALYFYPMGRASFDNTKAVINFCIHYNTVFVPIRSNPYWIIKSFNPMIGRVDSLKVSAEKFPPFENLTPIQRKEFSQVLPYLHFVDSRGGYYTIRDENTVINLYHYDQQDGERKLIKQEKIGSANESLFNHAFQKMIHNIIQSEHENNETGTHHRHYH